MFHTQCESTGANSVQQLDLEAPCLANFYPLLAQDGRKRIPISCVRHMFEDAYKLPQADMGFDKLLKEELTKLLQMQMITIPQNLDGSQWTSSDEGLPDFVITRMAPGESLPNPSEIVWVPALASCASLTSVKQIVKAKAVNEFLRKSVMPLETVPYRERALQIFGDEKALDLFIKDGRMFSTRIPLSAIGAVDIGPPAIYQPSGEMSLPILVVENFHSYWSFCKWNAKSHAYSAIFFGAGGELNKLRKSLAFVALDVDSSEIEYLGDLDYAGLRIPANFNSSGEKLKLIPAMRFYDWLLRHGVRRPKLNEAQNDQTLQKSLAWLDSIALQYGVVQLFAEGHWIPQESLGIEALMRDFPPN